MPFELLGPIGAIEVIATGRAIREAKRLKRVYGGLRWRKLKGIALVRVGNLVSQAELHWYEAHGVGRKELKLKKLLP